MKKDVIIIGGGPAGLMASIAAAENGASVILLDKGNKLGRKLAISGGGRCNVTNRADIEEIIRHIPGNGRFMYSPFSVFDNEDIIEFFEGLGIKLKQEDHGRMFPINDKAKEVVNALLNRIRTLNVDIRTNTKVQDLLFDNDDQKVTGVLLSNQQKIYGNNVIIAAGGMSVPETGSTGDGYPWAKKAGHSITELYPTEVPITCNDPFIKSRDLQGLSFRDVALSVIDPKKAKPIITHKGDMIFTHFGISGPISLRCSQYIVKAKKKHQVNRIALQLDLFPEEDEQELLQRLHLQLSVQPKKTLKNGMIGFVPERIIPVLLNQISFSPTIQVSEILPHHKLHILIKQMKAFPITATGTLSIEKAFVTGGGVSVKEIQPKRMESKKIKGLFFCGEVLDLHGYTGGYNITVAFSTGYTAGKAAASHT